MTRNIISAIFLCSFLLLGNWETFSQTASTPEPDKTTQPANGQKSENKEGRIKAGDRLLVKVYPEDEYIKGGEMQVSSEGEITLNIIGKVKVDGKKVAEAEQELVGIIGKDYLVNPIVVIELVKKTGDEEKRTLAILGQVQKPGSYEIPPDQKLTLLKLVSMAGGFTEIANVKKIKVIRKDKEKTKVLRANAESIISGSDPDIELEQGDVVHVAESFF